MGGSNALKFEPEFPPRFRIAEFSVDSTVGTVTGPAASVQVDPKVMEVLVLLARRCGKAVPREELLSECWPGIVVSDDALTRCVYQLRQHLIRAGGHEYYKALVETYPKRGYRLNCQAPIETAAPDVSVIAASRIPIPRSAARFTSSRAIGLAALIVGISVVVAFTWRNTEHGRGIEPPIPDGRAYEAFLRGNEYFGRSDRQTALPYAEALYRRAAALDPSFRQAWAGLARTNTDMYWHSLDRTAARLSQAEWALERMSALDSSSSDTHLAKANYLLKGMRRYEDALLELRDAEVSGATDPELYFLRGMAYRRLGQWDLAIEAVNKALEIDPDNISYLRQQHISYLFVRDYARAEQLLDHIVALFPDDGTAYVDKVVLALCSDGDTALAHRYQRNSPSESYDDGLAYTYTSWLAAVFDRDFDRALRVLDTAVEDPIFDGDMRNSSFGPKALFYARTYRFAGQDEKAHEAYGSVLELLGQRGLESGAASFRLSAGELLALAEVQAGLGRPKEALAALQQARELAPDSRDDLMASSVRLESVLRVLVPAGFEEEALRQLEGYLRNRAGHWSIEGLRADPRLEPIRDHAGFKLLEEKYRRS